jgi:hypothetical protein
VLVENACCLTLTLNKTSPKRHGLFHALTAGLDGLNLTANRRISNIETQNAEE